jgi:cytochrome P450
MTLALCGCSIRRFRAVFLILDAFRCNTFSPAGAHTAAPSPRSDCAPQNAARQCARMLDQGAFRRADCIGRLSICLCRGGERRQVLVEDQAAYRKSTLERRVLSARLRNGLVAVDGEQWQRLRRILAPLFARKTIIGFAPQMAHAVECVAGHWQTLSEGSTVAMKTEMLRLPLDHCGVRCWSWP